MLHKDKIVTKAIFLVSVLDTAYKSINRFFLFFVTAS